MSLYLSKIQAARFAFGGMALFFLVLTMAMRRPGATWDENFTGSYFTSLAQYGFGKELLVHQSVAMGPLYILTLKALTLGSTLALYDYRWFSLFFFLLTLAVLEKWIRKERPGQKGACVLFMGVPAFTLMAGFAMSDLLANLLFLSSLLILKVSQESRERTPTLTLAFLAGTVLGLAISGRQLYLPGLVAPVILVYYRRDFLIPAILFAVPAVLLPLPIFLSWKGLLAPSHVVLKRSIFYLPYSFMAFAESGLVLSLFCPSIFVRIRRSVVPFTLIALILTALLPWWLPRFGMYVPLGWVVRPLAPSLYYYFVKISLFLCLLLAMGMAAFILEKTRLAETAWEKSLWCITTLLILAPGFVTFNYSIRYLIAPSILLCLLCLDDVLAARFTIGRWALGAITAVLVLAKFTRVIGL